MTLYYVSIYCFTYNNSKTIKYGGHADIYRDPVEQPRLIPLVLILGQVALITLMMSFTGWTRWGRICEYEGNVTPFASASASEKETGFIL
jgi:hypothetical protein